MGGKRKKPSRREVIGGLAATTALACGPKVRAPNPKQPIRKRDFELDEVTIGELRKQMEAGTRSSREITALYLDRIEAINRDGANLRAVIEVNLKALEIAEQFDAELERGAARGPLHGIPVLLKDNLATADGMENTAGSLALVGHKPPRDAHTVMLLRRAGAVILGKANLSEWANIRSTRSTSGWSARGGLCRSPYVLDRNPCGSSSGSGVAAAANMCAVAIGTETDGSVVCPSSHNSLVGIKPTVGAVSRSGIIPISSSQDTAGPMARTVTDAALTYAAMIGADKLDTATDGKNHAQLISDLATATTPGGLKGARIGVARSLFGFHSGVDAVLEEAIRDIARAGAVVIDPIELAKESILGDLELDILLTELKATMAVHLADLGPGSPKTLADLIAFNRENADKELVHFGQELFEMAEKKGPANTDEFYAKREKLQRGAREEGIDKAMAAHNLDAIIAPSNGPAWATDFVNGDHYVGGSSSPAAIAGYPNITVPAGFVTELPVGLSFFGSAWSDAKLVRIAFDFERIRPARQKPRFIPSLEE